MAGDGVLATIGSFAYDTVPAALTPAVAARLAPKAVVAEATAEAAAAKAIAPKPVAHPTFEPGAFAGDSIPATGPQQTFTAAERASINQIGKSTGCHTCGTTTPGTKSGNFVPDHQPVSSLNANNGPQRLYPQCINCSREQGLAAARELRKVRKAK